MGLHLITYISDFALPASEADLTLRKIVQTAQRENPRRQITGVLFFINGKFLQIIEGEEAHLRQLMRNIEADPRHGHVEYLIDCPVDKRGFQQWNMDSFNLDAESKFSALTLRDLTESFKKNLLVRSDSLVFYYRALLAKAA